MSYLDKEGLTYLWGKIKTALSQKVDAVPSEWIPLPLTSDDWVNHGNWGKSWYTKTATGVVYLHIAVESSEYITGTTQIALLPVGFRPAHGFFAVGVDPSTNGYVAAAIQKNGAVQLRQAPIEQFNFKYAVVDVSFLAAN